MLDRVGPVNKGGGVNAHICLSHIALTKLVVALPVIGWQVSHGIRALTLAVVASSDMQIPISHEESLHHHERETRTGHWHHRPGRCLSVEVVARQGLRGSWHAPA